MKAIYKVPLILLVLFTVTYQANAQDSLAIAKEMYNMGIELFEFTTRRQAKEMFVQATDFDPNYTDAYLMAGKATLMTVNKDEALPYLQKAYELNPQVDDEILYFIGQAYQYGENFDDAITYYQAYRNKLARSLSFDKSRKIYDLEWRIFECRNAKIYLANPVDVDITNLSENINTEYPEYAPLISADEKILIFTSRRPENTNPNLAEDFAYYEDIYKSEFKNGQWQPSEPFPSQINGDFHNSDIGLSADGTVLYIYTDENGGDILVSRKVDGEWSSAKQLKGLINTPYRESSATITADKKIMYFTSDKPGGYGGTDIYVSELADNGRWGKPINLGVNINTERDEVGPFVSKSGENLYFSSNGHAGMGDLDIYVANRTGNIAEFGRPVNMGYPINSVENDVFFVLSGDEKSAYYSSVKSTSKGEEDIYKINMERWVPINIDSIAANEIIEIERAVIAKVQPRQIDDSLVNTEISLLLTILDAQSLDTLEANVALINQENQTVIGATKNNTGTYGISFTNSDYTTYKVKINKENYFPYESMIYVIGYKKHKHTILETIALQPIKESYTGVMNVYFGVDSDQPYGLEDIQYLEFLMKDNPGITVEIGGHTDNTGSVEYNKYLSQRRADAIKKYLTEHGIDASRINSIGYGVTKPIGDNNTRVGRRLNRRTEFKILKN